MGFVSELFGLKPTNMNLTDLRRSFGYEQTQSGVPVDRNTALELASVWQALTQISGDVSRFPLNVWERRPDLGPDARELATKHQAYRYVKRLANERTSAKRFWQRVVFHLLLWNNSYVWIKRSPTNNTVLGLYNLLPDRTTYDAENDLYISEIKSQAEPFKPNDILHFQGMNSPGTVEPYFLKSAKESLGLALAAQKHTAQFFTGNCNPGGILEIPASFRKQAKDNLERGLQKKLSGKSFQTLILGDGAKFHQVQIDAEKSQMTETRLHQIREVASWFNVPASRLNSPDSAGYGSRAEDNRNYYDQTLSHWLEEVAQECNLKLLTSPQLKNDTHYFEHDVSKLLQTDRKTQAEVAKIEVEMGALSPDEYRAQTGRNPRPDGGGSVYIQHNANFIPAESSEDTEQVEETDEGVINLVRNCLIDGVNKRMNVLQRLVSKRKDQPNRLLSLFDDLESHMKLDRELFDLGESLRINVNYENMMVRIKNEGLDAIQVCKDRGFENTLWADSILSRLNDLQKVFLDELNV